MRDFKTGRFTAGGRPEIEGDKNPFWKNGVVRRPDGYLVRKYQKKISKVLMGHKNSKLVKLAERLQKV